MMPVLTTIAFGAMGGLPVAQAVAPVNAFPASGLFMPAN